MSVSQTSSTQFSAIESPFSKVTTSAFAQQTQLQLEEKSQEDDFTQSMSQYCCNILSKIPTPKDCTPSEWIRLISFGLAQDDLDKSSEYPFMVAKFALPFPPSVQENVDKDASKKVHIVYWINSALQNNGELDPKNKKDQEWIEKYSTDVAKEENDRSKALRQIPIEKYGQVSQVDFSWMNFSKKEIVGRINAAANTKLVNLKNCQIDDETLKQMNLSKKLQLLILSYNPITDASIPVLKKIAEGRKIDSFCLAHTKITKAAIDGWRNEDKQIKLFYD